MLRGQAGAVLDTEMHGLEAALPPGRNWIPVSPSILAINVGVQEGHHCEEVTSEPEKKVLETSWEIEVARKRGGTFKAVRGFLWPHARGAPSSGSEKGTRFSLTGHADPSFTPPGISLGQT